MKVYKCDQGLVAESRGELRLFAAEIGIDAVFGSANPGEFLTSRFQGARRITEMTAARAPLQSQEVWAAGVTYQRSRVARVAESKDSGGATFYDKVYDAKRPELFFKASSHRVAGPGESVRIRRDAKWNVPEPELTLAINSLGRVFGYTVGNDMSSRDIEAENPLYLPQAKVYDRSAAIGPCLLVTDSPPPPETEIAMTIGRAGNAIFSGETPISRIKRTFPELVEFLFRDHSFPHGCFLMTGTGIVPPDHFTLEPGDEISVTIAPIGTLSNTVHRIS